VLYEETVTMARTPVIRLNAISCLVTLFQPSFFSDLFMDWKYNFLTAAEPVTRACMAHHNQEAVSIFCLYRS
jgi:hypothetical protein